MSWPRNDPDKACGEGEVSLTPLPPATRPSRLLLFLKGFFSGSVAKQGLSIPTKHSQHGWDLGERHLCPGCGQGSVCTTSTMS